MATKIEVGTGISQGRISFDAGAEAASRALAAVAIRPLSVVIVYASVAYDLVEALRGVRSVVGYAPVIGATTAGEICRDASHQGVIVSIWGSPHIAVFSAIGRNVSADWSRAVQDAISTPAAAPFFSSAPDHWQRLTLEGKSVFGVLFCPGNTRRDDSRAHEILEAIKTASESRFPIFAAGAADDWRMTQNHVLSGEEAVADGLLLAIFETRLQFGVALTHGFRPTGVSVSVTAAVGKEVLTIDGRPAGDEMAKMLGSNLSSLEGKHVSLTAGRAIGTRNGMGNYNVFVATFLTPGGGCRLSQAVTPGTVLTAMEPHPEFMRQAGSEALRKAILRGGVTRPAAAMIGYCALRERFMGGDAVAEEISLMGTVLGDTPLFGFFSFGEGGVSDDGVSRHSNVAVSALVIGADLSASARVALEAQAARREIEQRAIDLESEVFDRSAALAASEERFHLAMRGANDGLWDLDLSTNKTTYSPRWKSMLGYEEDQDDDLDWNQLVHPDDLARKLDHMRMCLENKSDYQIEFRIRHKDGHYVDVLSRAFLILDERGNPLRMIGTHLDISERKRTERAQQQAAIVLNCTHEGVVITGPDGVVISINPAFQKITGYAEADVLQRNMRILKSERQGSAFFKTMWRSLRETGCWQGEIWNSRKSGEIYPQWLTINAVRDERDQVVNYVGVFSDITQLKESEARLEHMAHHDSLTGLPNRALLLSRLETSVIRAKRSCKTVAVLFIDLDRFKNVNDSLGHPAGDELLVLAVKRLQERLRNSDTLARLGGDEFIAILEGLARPEDAGRLADQLIGGLTGQPFLLGGVNEVYLGASIGVSLFPADGETAHELIQHADAALYQAKDDGRGIYRFYSPAMTQAAGVRLEMEAGLRRALEREEFYLHFQPIICMTDGRTIGAEAVVRWQHPQFGSVAPDEFIPLAEETGLIVPLGDWVLRAACERMKAWLEMGVKLDIIAVNLSPRQFQDPDIYKRIRTVLSETGLPPQCLELEITEGALLRDGEAACLKMALLKSLGVRIAIDDFGIGYSSLAYLKRLPIDKLKIDKCFVQGITLDATDIAIVTAVIGLAQNLRFTALAEGVETQAQLDILKGLGCDSAQGYLFSRPLPEAELLSFLGVQQAADSAPEKPPSW